MRADDLNMPRHMSGLDELMKRVPFASVTVARHTPYCGWYVAGRGARAREADLLGVLRLRHAHGTCG